MSSIRTSNPAFSDTIFGQWEQADRRSQAMTVQGTAVKAIGLLAIVVACAAATWTKMNDSGISTGLLLGSAIGGGVFMLITFFKKSWAPITAPLYAACQGVFLGAISNLVNLRFPGIVAQAVGLTFATAALMFFFYATGIIKVTGRLVAAVSAGTTALGLFYLGSLLMSFMGMNGGMNLIYSSGTVGLAISAVAVGLSAFRLLLDFDFIADGARYEAPKSFEWYGAFALTAELIYLYMEILRLLMKLQDRR